MTITIAYFTNRREPHFEWFARSLRRERADIAELIVVDFWANHATTWLSRRRRDVFKTADCNTRLTAPKPCVFQGPHRLTSRDYFAAANARNTAFALCRSDFIACVDDVSALLPGWWDAVRHAAHHGYVAMGSYKKVHGLKVSNDAGAISFDSVASVDSRWDAGSDGGIVPASGTMMFGCSFAMPLELALRVNGFDEICDGQGAEDYDFGIRLERAGARLYYNRNMLTYEDEDAHAPGPGDVPFPRVSKEMDWKGERIGSDHVLLRRVQQEDRIWTVATQTNLRELRARLAAGEGFPVPTAPTLDWRTGKPLAEM